MCKDGGGIAGNVERGMNDFTFEPLPDFSCFWFGPGGPERCFLLGDLLPLIIVQDERFILTFLCEKKGLEFQAILEDTGYLVILSFFFFLIPTLCKKPRQTLKHVKEKLLEFVTSLFFSWETKKMNLLCGSFVSA